MWAHVFTGNVNSDIFEQDILNPAKHLHWGHAQVYLVHRLTLDFSYSNRTSGCGDAAEQLHQQRQNCRHLQPESIFSFKAPHRTENHYRQATRLAQRWEHLSWAHFKWLTQRACTQFQALKTPFLHHVLLFLFYTWSQSISFHHYSSLANFTKLG